MRHHKLLNICNMLLLLLLQLVLLLVILIIGGKIVVIVASFLACEMTDHLRWIVKHWVFLVHQRLDELIGSIAHTIEIIRLLFI